MRKEILDLLNELHIHISSKEYEEMRSRINELGGRMSILDLSLGYRYERSILESEETVNVELFHFVNEWNSEGLKELSDYDYFRKERRLMYMIVMIAIQIMNTNQPNRLLVLMNIVLLKKVLPLFQVKKFQPKFKKSFHLS